MSGFLPARRVGIVLLAAAVLAVAAAVEAQFIRGGGRMFFRYATPADFDGGFHFCRVQFRSDMRGDGDGWSVDSPDAEINVSIRLAELTRTNVSVSPGGEPNIRVIRLTDDTLFHCPFIMMTEPGSAYLDEQEVARLREYLLKGGFLWTDDFWGSRAWEWWVGQLQQVLPPSEYPIIDLPHDHVLFRMMLDVKGGVPQISSIGFWLRTGSTSERGADSAVATARAVLDERGHIMVLMTHNTDLGDSWEREAEDPGYFYNFSVPGYAFGINTFLYAMTH